MHGQELGVLINVDGEARADALMGDKAPEDVGRELNAPAIARPSVDHARSSTVMFKVFISRNMQVEINTLAHQWYRTSSPNSRKATAYMA